MMSSLNCFIVKRIINTSLLVVILCDLWVVTGNIRTWMTSPSLTRLRERERDERERERERESSSCTHTHTHTHTHLVLGSGPRDKAVTQ